MKNQIKYINSMGAQVIAGLFALVVLFSSCNKEEEAYSGPITIGNIYLQDAESTVPDRLVTFIRLGQTMRIEGTGFTDLRRVEINGYETYFNPVMATDVNLVMKVSNDTPLIEADSSVRNTIKFINDGSQTVINFDIRDAAPTITNVSHTLPIAGEEITISGSGLTEIYRIVFPGDIEVTTGITSSENGKYCKVTVPDGVSQTGGSIMVEGSNGGAYSPAYFNCTENVILDFDGNGTQGYWGWSEDGSMINNEDLDSVEVGSPNVSHGVYVPHRPKRLTSIAANTYRCTEVWTAGNGVDNWRAQLSDNIPTTTPVSDVAFQFDIYVPDEWTETGYLKILLVNGYQGNNWSGYLYNYVPWIVDGEVVPFKTNGWETITVPFNKFYGFAEGDFTFEDVLAKREEYEATPDWYKNFGFYFENSNFSLDKVTGNESDAETEMIASETSVDVYTDNWRVVSLETPRYSDFDDE